MADEGPLPKRFKHFSSDWTDDMDSEETITITDDEMSDSSTWYEPLKLNKSAAVGQPLVLKVPRKYMRVPQNLQGHGIGSPSSTVINDKRKRRSLIPKTHFEALERMPLDVICVFTDTSAEFKEIAERYFAVKYRDMRLSSLAEPKSGKYSLIKVQRLLRLFGHLIWSLALDLDLDHLDERDSCSDLLALVRNHCSTTLGWMVL